MIIPHGSNDECMEKEYGEAIAIGMIGDLHSQAYSRDVEAAAVVTGSDICAAAGFDPWGPVWLFQDFQNADLKQIPELLSDHPANESKIKTLEEHFRDSPSVYSRFNSVRASAMSVFEDARQYISFVEAL